MCKLVLGSNNGVVWLSDAMMGCLHIVFCCISYIVYSIGLAAMSKHKSMQCLFA